MQRTRVSAALLALLLAALMALPLTAAAATATLSARFEISSSSVSISGTLTVDGKGLTRERVIATLDGETRDATTTKGNGEFSLSFKLPSGLSAGTHEVAVVFQGSDAASGARAAATFTISGSPSDDNSDRPIDPGDGGSSSEPGSTAAPTTQAPAATTLTVTDPGEAVNGSLITLDGSLSTGSGGIGNAGITVSDGAGEVDESFTVTGSDGAFTTYYSVPDDAPDGTLTLTLSFAGTSTLAAASTQVAVAVTHTDVASPEPSESPSPSPSASASPSVTAATPSPDATPVTTEATGSSGFPFTGFLIAVATVGAVGIITASVLVYRGMHGREHLDDEERSLDMFDDGPPPTAPRRG